MCLQRTPMCRYSPSNALAPLTLVLGAPTTSIKTHSPVSDGDHHSCLKRCKREETCLRMAPGLCYHVGKHHIPAPYMCHHAPVIRRYDTLCTRQSKRGSVFVYVHWLGAKGGGCFTDLAIACRCAQPRRQLLAFGVRPCTTVVAPGPTLELTTKLF
jgi:hypothetical protein